MHQPISDEEQEIQNKIDNINALHIPGYEEEVLKFIEDNNIDVLNRNGPLGDNLLYTACKNRATNIALALIKKGVDVNPPSDWTGNTPLIYACINSLEEVALALIEKGAYVDMEDLNENTPLIIACENGLEDVAMAIITAGVIKKKRKTKNPLIGDNDIEKNTPLHYACRNGLLKVVEYIITNDKELLKIGNSIGKTPIDFMIAYTNETGNTKLMYYILENTDVTIDDLNAKGLDDKIKNEVMTTEVFVHKKSTARKIPLELGRYVNSFHGSKNGGKTKRRRKTKRSKKRKSRRKKD